MPGTKLPAQGWGGRPPPLPPAIPERSENQNAGFGCMTINGELQRAGRIIYLSFHSSVRAKPNSACLMGLRVRANAHGLAAGQGPQVL